MTSPNRRTFLRAAGVSLALPALEVGARASTSEAPARRMVLVDLMLGLHPPNLYPQRAGRDYDSTLYLDVMGEYRDDFTVISGVRHPDVHGGHKARQSFLTAAPGPTSASFKNTISVDQFAAEKLGHETRFAALSLCLHPGDGLSYSRSGVQIPAETSPSRVFTRLFVDGRPQDRERRIDQLRQGRSILDAVREKARRMEKRLGTTDREKLDQYFTAVREAEQRLLKAEAWTRRAKPRVAAGPPRDIGNGADVIGRGRLMFDIIHLALQTDSTRLITLHLNGPGAAPPIRGVSQGYHALSHHGQDAQRIAQLERVELRQMQLFAGFLQKLRESKEQGGTLLDHTMVMLGSDIGDGSSHSNDNLPVILAGGGFRHGQHLAFDRKNNYPLPNLFVSMLQRLGLEIDTFASSTGTMRGLEFV